MSEWKKIVWVWFGVLALGASCVTAEGRVLAGSGVSGPAPGTRAYYEQNIRGVYAFDNGVLVRIAGVTASAPVAPVIPGRVRRIPSVYGNAQMVGSVKMLEARVLQVLSPNMVVGGKPVTNASGVVRFPRSCLVTMAGNRLPGEGTWLRLQAVSDGYYDYVTSSGANGTMAAFREVTEPTFEEYRQIYERECQTVPADPLVTAVSTSPGMANSREPGIVRAESAQLPTAPDIIAEAEKGASDLLKVDLRAVFTARDGSPCLFVREPETKKLRVLTSASLPASAALLAVDEAKAVVVLGRGSRSALLGALRACKEVDVQSRSTKGRTIELKFNSASLDMVMRYLSSELMGCGMLMHPSSSGGRSISLKTTGDVSDGEAIAIIVTALSYHDIAIDVVGDLSGGYFAVRHASTPSLAAERPFHPRWPVVNRSEEITTLKLYQIPVPLVLQQYVYLHCAQLSASVISNLVWQAQTFTGSVTGSSPKGGLPLNEAAYVLERLLEWQGVEFMSDGASQVTMRQNIRSVQAPSAVLPVRQPPISSLKAMTGEALQKHLENYQMDLIRAAGEKGPPLPMQLTPEMDAQLVHEGVLKPQD